MSRRILWPARLLCPALLLWPALLLTACLTAPALAQDPLTPVADPPAPRFDRLYDYDAVVTILRGYAEAYPDWVELASIGQSREGRDLWMLTIHNPATGPAETKPAMYVDANTHANEVQGAETCLYLVEFMLSNYGRLPRVTELLDRAVFHVLPVINPDGRVRWFGEPATPHFPRTVAVPIDDDRDGLADEDGYDDLDGDGVITQMRKRVPLGEGNYRLDHDDPRLLVRVEKDELGDYVRLGSEGIDNDGDGEINEDPLGYLDPNRTFGYDWQPRYVQRGSSDYPLQIPETRSIADWAMTHPNVAAAQSFHNAGQMILRGPGSRNVPDYPASDVAVFDAIADEGERLLPGYRSMVIWKDLYTAHGSTIDHFYAIHGAISFTNELYKAPLDMDEDGTTTPEERMDFNDLLTLGRQRVEWTEVEHPQFGTVEVGGSRHDVGRVPERWQLEDECHRNAAFVLFHARQLPKLRVGEPSVERLADTLWRVEIPLTNERAIPSVTQIARQNRLHRLDIATLQGAKVLSSGVIRDPLRNRIALQEHEPARLRVPGIPGMRRRRLMFLVEAAAESELQFAYDSVKAGRLEATITLE